MNAAQWDLIVVGLGAMGAAALYQASRRGLRVLGIDRYHPPHNMGSSHGDTRITRHAIGEGELYMPFIQRSNAIWQQLEAASGRTLFHRCGGLIIGAPQAAAFHFQQDFVGTSARIARQYGIAHELLDAHETMRRHPLLKLRAHEVAYFEPGAGLLRPERCIQTQLELAQAAGVALQTGERLLRYEPSATAVQLVTDKGSYSAAKLILATGAWIGEALPAQLRASVRVCRQVIHWFEAEDIRQFRPERFPFVIALGDSPEEFWSAFPSPHDGRPGVKLLTEQYDSSTQPDEVERAVQPEEAADIYQRLTRPRLRGLRARALHGEVCLYTLTADEHFLIDRHPASERVVLASPCSGHGFKHSAAIGECLVQLALDGGCALDIADFRFARFATI